jgi:hypothetical protein
VSLAVDRSLGVDSATFGGPSSVERLKACFVDLIKRDMKKGHKNYFGGEQSLRPHTMRCRTAQRTVRRTALAHCPNCGVVCVVRICAVAQPSRLARCSNSGRETWRGGCRSDISVSTPFVWRCLSGSTMCPGVPKAPSLSPAPSQGTKGERFSRRRRPGPCCIRTDKARAYSSFEIPTNQRRAPLCRCR